MHHELSIYKQAYALLSFVTDIIRNIPRDMKAALGTPVRDECIKLLILVSRANAAKEPKDKVPHLDQLIEKNDVIAILVRILRDKRFISVGQHAKAIALSVSVGKQANGWRKSCRPA